jgi:nucleoid DNA-binding protein
MNKQELIQAVANEIENKSTATGAVDAMFDTITKSLKNGENVVLTGFGTFKVKTRKARDGRNPRTGDIVKIPQRSVPVFKAGSELKAAVN